MTPIIIGDATLYCGDCRDILPTLPPSGAIVSDPPYGLGDRMTGGTKRFQTSEGGLKMLGAWDAQAVDGLLELIADAAPIKMLWGGNYYPVPASSGWLVWVKTNSVQTMASIELCWTNLDMNSKHFMHACTGWHRDHPTQKPIRLMEWCLSFIPHGDSVIDPFMGSGTTGVASIASGRKFTGIEQDKKHFESACRRIEKFYSQASLFPTVEIKLQIQDSFL